MAAVTLARTVRIGAALISALTLVAAAAAPARADPEPGPPPVEAYAKLPALDQVALSPSGARTAFVAAVGPTRRLIASSADGRTVLFAGDVGEAKVVGLDWAGEDHMILTLSHTHSLVLGYSAEKAEVLTVLVINLATGSMFNVFKDQPMIAPLVYGRYGSAEVGGRWYGYFAGETYEGRGRGMIVNTRRIDLYAVDLDTGRARIVSRGSPHAAGWVVGPDGTVIARALHDQVTGDWRVLSGGVGGRVLASGVSRLSGVGLARGRTADSVLITLPADLGSTLETVSLAGGAPQPAPDDVATPLFDPVSRLWVGEVVRRDRQAVRFFDVAAQARAAGALKAFPRAVVAAVSAFTPDLGRLVVKTSGGGDAGTYWLADIATGKASPIGAAYPEVPDAAVGPIETVDWTAPDGLALHGVLSLPPGRSPQALPVVVMPHGGPEDRDYPVFAWWAQLFVSRGYAVFQPNYRGSAGYGLAFRDAGFGHLAQMQGDIASGLAALAERGVVDPSRACIAGWSFGGYLAQAAVTLRRAPYRCAVSMAGQSDLGRFLDDERNLAGADSDDYRYWKAVIGAASPRDDRLDAISPARHADQASAPMLLIHGADDSLVPIAQSRDMARALGAAGKAVELVALPNADHWLLNETARIAMAKASLDFVLKHNPPDSVGSATP
jgi:dipeptidyl aminopeptidase/acylaminoacyl peptidase